VLASFRSRPDSLFFPPLSSPRRSFSFAPIPLLFELFSTVLIRGPICVGRFVFFPSLPCLQIHSILPFPVLLLGATRLLISCCFGVRFSFSVFSEAPPGLPHMIYSLCRIRCHSPPEGSAPGFRGSFYLNGEMFYA